MRILILTSLLAAFCLQAEMKIAVADMERALNEVSDGQAAKAKLEAESKKKQDLLEKKQAEFTKLKDAFQAQSPNMTEQARQAKGMELEKKYMEGQQMAANMQQELAKKHQEETNEILKKAKPIIQDIAKKEGYDLVVNQNDAIVLYAKPDVNITNELVKRYNTAYPVSTKKKK